MLEEETGDRSPRWGVPPSCHQRRKSGVIRGWLFPVAIVGLFQAALCAQKIDSGYDETFPLSELKTFGFLAQERSEPDGLASNRQAEALIRENLVNQFLAAGFVPAETEPDLLIAFYAKTTLKTSWTAAGYARLGEFGSDHYEVGTLVVDVISHRIKRAVWQGVASKALRGKDREERREIVEDACAKLVERFRKDAEKQAKKKR